MFLTRLRPLYLFLLLMLPAIAGSILQQAPSFARGDSLRMQILGVNFSTIFAMLFALWIIGLAVALAPTLSSRWLIITGMAGGAAFRGWQDSWAIDELHATGKIMDIEKMEMLSPLFILHALVSVIMIITLVMLSVWLVRKEKAEGINAQPLWLTIIQLFVFPIGLFWVQKRVQAACFEESPETEA